MTSTEELCQQYIGLEFKAKGRKKWVECLIHGEKTASLCLYPDGKLYCYGCHFKGDGLDLVGAVLGTPLSAVLKMVAADHGIANNDNTNIDLKIIKKVAAERQKKEQIRLFKEQVDNSYNYLANVYRQFRVIEKSVKKLEDLDRQDVAMAFNLMPIIDGIMDMLSSLDIEDQYKGLQWGRRLNLW